MTTPAIGTVGSIVNVVCDGVSSGSQQLASVDATGMAAFSTVAYCKSDGSSFVLVPASGVTSDNKEFVTALNGGGQQWRRINGAITTVDTIPALRAYAAVLSPSVMFFTRGYLSPGDGGGSMYRWNPASTTTDDGILNFQLDASPSMGRFELVSMSKKVFSQICGTPKAAGTPAYSFDRTGTVPIGTEMERVTKLLSSNGYAGILFDPAGTYTSNRTEQICQRAENIGFVLDGQGATLASASGSLPLGGALIFRARAAGDTAAQPAVLLTGGYVANGATTAQRKWTQTPSGFSGNETVMTAISSLAAVGTVPSVQVGQGVLVRIGACRTDGGGWSFVQYFAHISAVDTGTRNVTFDQPLPNLPGFDQGLQPSGPRFQDQHDFIVIDPNGYQDGLVIKNFILDNVQLDGVFDRDTVINCKWKNAIFGYNMTGSVNLTITAYVESANFLADTANEFGALQACHGTHITKLAGTFFVSAHGEELGTEGTRIDLLDMTWDASQGGLQTVSAVQQSALETNLISVGQMTLRGGKNRCLVNPNCHVQSLDIQANNQEASAGVAGGAICWYTIDLSKVDRLTYAGPAEAAPRSYSGKRWVRHFLPYPKGSGVANYTWTSPIAGLVRQCRIMATGDLTNIAHVYIGTTTGGGPTDIKAALTVGSWVNIPYAQAPDIVAPDFWGLGRFLIIPETTGTNPPAGNQFAVDIEYFVPDSPYYSQSDPDGRIVGDSSVPMTITTDGPPTVNSDFIGQDCLDTTNKVYYRSVHTGSGSADWVSVGGTPATSPAPLIFTGSVVGNAGGAATFYLANAGSFTPSTAQRYPVTTARTFTKLRVTMLSNTHAVDPVVTVIKNGVTASAMTVTGIHTDAAFTKYADLAHSLSLTTSDDFDVKITCPTDSAAGASQWSVSLE